MPAKKLQKCRAMAAKSLVQNGDRFVVVEGAGDQIKALGGKREDADKDSWDTLSRELVEEAGLTEIKCVGGPFYHNGANYFHVTTTQTPVSRDVKVISHNLTELRSAENKDFTLKTVLSLFVKQRNFPFDMRPQMDADRQELRDLREILSRSPSKTSIRLS